MRKIFIILTIFISSIMFIGNISANGEGIMDDNADANAMSSGHNACPNGLCLWNNGNEGAVEVSMVYVDNNGVKTYHTEVWTNNKASNGTVTSNGNVMVYKDFLPSGGNYIAISQALENYFLANNGANANAWYNQYADTSLATQDANSSNPAEYGSRIFMTPVLSTMDHGSKNYINVKEIAGRWSELTNKGRLVEIAKLFTTEYNDVGILHVSETELASMSADMIALLLGNMFNGLGYNIIDFMKSLGLTQQQINMLIKKPAPSCPNGSMSLSNPNPSCKEAINGLTYTYSYTAGGGGQGNVHRQYGEDQNAPGTGAYCKLFCQEYGTATLPGALADSVQLGSYIIWPTSDSNKTNKFSNSNYYPLKFSGRKSCKLVLMPDHNNFPGNGCFQDPVAEYECLYNGTKVPGSKYVCTRTYANSILNVGQNLADYAGIKWDKVRTGNGNYFNEPEYCGVRKESDKLVEWGGAMKGSAMTYKKFNSDLATYYNSNNNKNGVANRNKYNELIDNINNAAKAAKSACENITQTDIDNANKNEKCDVCPGGWMGAECPGGTEKDTCQYIKDARNKTKACGDAKKNYSDVVGKATEWEEGNIDKCKAYITDFNYARNILNEIGMCGNFSADGDTYYRFTSSASSEFTNGSYTVNGSLKKEQSASIGCEGQCGGLSFKEKPDYTTIQTMDTVAVLNGKVSQIENRTITFTAETDVYGMSDGFSYVDKATNKYSKTQLDSNYLEIKTLNKKTAKVLPTDYDAEILDSNGSAKKYNLTISNATFGEQGRFKINNYVCKYEVAKKNDGCVCPQDSKMPGKDLMGYVISDPISCPDAQEKYCDSGDDNPANPEDEYCPDMKTPITACLKTGIGKDACVKQECPNGNDGYRCKNSNGIRDGMDVTDCVQTKRSQGLSLNEALDYCDSVVCPIGKTIIYRTIRLENPFPSYNADVTVPQTALKDRTKYRFNNTMYGRFPGSNWNGTILVYNKIRNNREPDTNSLQVALNDTVTSGTTIYQTKTPLYSFRLTGSTIKAIRDYNDKQAKGYNDFTLECKTNHSSGCISYTFVHKPALSGLTGGTCSNISLDNSFYRCAD